MAMEEEEEQEEEEDMHGGLERVCLYDLFYFIYLYLGTGRYQTILYIFI